MADSMNIKHTLKQCDEITEKYVSSKHGVSWWDESIEPHLIEIRTDDVTNDFLNAAECLLLPELQKYDIIKFLETTTGEVVSEKRIMFNVDRKQTDLLLGAILKPTQLRQRNNADETQVLHKKYKAVVAY